MSRLRGPLQSMDGRRLLAGVLLIMALLLVAGAAGCASTAGGLQAYVVPAPAAEYLISPGDEIEVRVFYEPKLGDRFTVPPDGKIRMQLIGPIEVVGRTPEDVAAELSEKYKPHLVNPDCTVVPRTLASRKVYIGGEVRLPGVVTMTGPATLPQVIFIAGGAKETARLSQVIVISQRPDGTAEHRVVDLEAFLGGKGSPTLLRLRSQDLVYVPRSRIAEINLFVDQYLRKLSPVLLSAGFSYTMDNVQ